MDLKEWLNDMYVNAKDEELKKAAGQYLDMIMRGCYVDVHTIEADALAYQTKGLLDLVDHMHADIESGVLECFSVETDADAKLDAAMRMLKAASELLQEVQYGHA